MRRSSHTGMCALRGVLCRLACATVVALCLLLTAGPQRAWAANFSVDSSSYGSTDVQLDGSYGYRTLAFTLSGSDLSTDVEPKVMLVADDGAIDDHVEVQTWGKHDGQWVLVAVCSLPGSYGGSPTSIAAITIGEASNSVQVLLSDLGPFTISTSPQVSAIRFKKAADDTEYLKVEGSTDDYDLTKLEGGVNTTVDTLLSASVIEVTVKADALMTDATISRVQLLSSNNVEVVAAEATFAKTDDPDGRTYVATLVHPLDDEGHPIDTERIADGTYALRLYVYDKFHHTLSTNLAEPDKNGAHYTLYAGKQVKNGDDYLAVYDGRLQLDCTAPSLQRKAINTSFSSSTANYSDGSCELEVRNLETHFVSDKSKTIHVVHQDDTEEDLATTVSWDGLAGGFTLPEGTYKQVSVRLVDAAGNEATADLVTDGKLLIVDNAAPKISVAFENIASGATTNTKDDVLYISGTRKATVTVEETNFFPGGMTVAVTTLDGATQTSNAHTGSFYGGHDWQHAGNVHTLELDFDDDGQYLLTVSGKDSVGNVAVLKDDESKTEYSSGTFVLDNEAPFVAVTDDGAEAAEDSFDSAEHAKLQLPATSHTYDGVSYYAHAISLYPRVKDRNFDPAGTTVSVKEGDNPEVAQSVTWKALSETRDAQGYLVYQTEQPVAYDTDGAYLSPHVVTCDLTTDATRNQTDNAGTLAKLVIDTKAPTITVDVDHSPASQGDADDEGDRINFYDLPTTMTFAVKDEHKLRKVQIDDPDGLYAVSESEAQAEGKGEVTLTLSLKDGNESYDGRYERDIVLTAEDLAGNVRTWTLDHKGTVKLDETESPADNAPINGGTEHPVSLIQDTVAPVVELAGVEAGEFYGGTQTLTTKVSEFNFAFLQLFRANRAIVTITRREPVDGGAVTTQEIPAKDFTGSTPSFSHTHTFDTDGHYSVSAQFEDIAGHLSNHATIGEFTIDTTPPELGVVFKNADGSVSAAKNGVLYVSGTRKATVTVKEHNFDPALFAISTTVEHAPKGYEGPVYDPAKWTGDGDTHTYVIDFDTDGRYTLAVTGKDLAGNVAVQADGAEGYASGVFVVDTEKPQIAQYYETGTAPSSEFDGDVPVVELPQPNGTYEGTSYYAHPVTLYARVKDRNFDTGATTLATSMNGKEAAQSVSWTRSPDKRGDNGYELYQTTVTYDKDGDYLTPHIVSTDLTTDAARNKADNKSQISKLVVDLKAPTIEADVDREPSAQGGSGDPYNFYNRATTMTFTVSDEHLLRSVAVDDPSKTYSVSASSTSALGKGSVVVTVKLRDGSPAVDAEYQRDIKLTATDLAGNQRIWTIDHTGKVVLDQTSQVTDNVPINDAKGKTEHPMALIQDTVAPVVGLSGVTVGSYYNKPQTVHATVNELLFGYLTQFDPARAIVTITMYEANAGRAKSTRTIPASAFSGSKPNFAHDEVFSTDGHYVLTAQFADYAGNLSNKAEIGEFTIDMTAPVISVEWDNNDVRHEKYYKATRTATITVVEHNFSPEFIKIETTGSISGWSTNGDTHTCTVFFGEGSAHTLKVGGEDLAGNAANEVTEPEFVVDLTPPEVVVEGTAQRLGAVSTDGEANGAYHDKLEDKSAYNGVVVPTINYKDNETLSAEDLGFTLSGTKHGEEVEAESSTSEEATEMTTTLRDLGYEGEGAGDGSNWANFYVDDYAADADDIYTLKATMMDRAGNEAEAELTFSVNRYGSNYAVSISDVAGDGLEQYKTSGILVAPPTITVREVNVAGVESNKDQRVEKEFANVTSSIQRKKDGEDGYSLVSFVGDDQANGWSEYVYTVRSGNFGAGSDSDNDDGGQGIYRVNVTSDDRSGNANTTAEYWGSDNKRVEVTATGATAQFILDELGPTIDDVNLPSKLSLGEEYQASFHVTDDITSSDVVEVWVDGRQLAADEVHGPSSGTGTFTFSVPAQSFNWARSVKIVVRDYAGREDTAGNGGWFWQSSFLPEGLATLGVLAVTVVAIAASMRRKAAAEPELPDW